MKITKMVAFGAAVGVALAGVALAAPANAEPVSNSYVMVGSDTLQDAANALANGSSLGGSLVRVKGGTQTVGSFDAFGTSAIQTKPNGPFFGRPAGSGAGVNALRASITGATYSGNSAVPARTITGQVDIARSSSGPGSNANANGQLLYVPFGRDAVAYAYKGSSDLANLTTAQLKQIYEANSPVTIGSTTVVARIPQVSSGTRSFFLSAIGVTTLGSTVVDANNTTTPENDAAVLGANEIIPFSAASWVAQSNGATGLSTIGSTGVQLGSPNGVAPFTGTGTSLVPNSTFYNAAPFGRDTYVVVQYARVNSADPAYDKGLADLIDPTKAQSLTNFGSLPATTGALKKKFGFLAPSTTTTQRAFLNL